MPAGSFLLVLHGHLPHVLHHGRWPHGESWLMEAASATWLPLARMADRARLAGERFPVTLGLTPVVLEQLAHPAFRRRFPRWLADRRERALADRAAFAARGDAHLAGLAERWAARFEDQARSFAELEGDLPGVLGRAWEAGVLEMMGSAATHGYLPLLGSDAACRVQVSLGLATSERHLGRRPTAFWMPECAFRPAGPWASPVLDRPRRPRLGTDALLHEAGVACTFIEGAHLRRARSEGVLEGEGLRRVGWDQAEWDAARCWRSPLEPHAVSTDGGPARVVVYARHPEVSEQVWSADVGYPGDPRYLEFHKRHGEDGLRYWRITGRHLDLGDKEPYRPEEVGSAVYAQAQHFAHLVADRLRAHREATGRHGVVVAAFDAELFGHWWHEGLAFLREVLLALEAHPEVAVQTAGEHLAAHPPDKVVWLPEGSWGEGGDHRVWLNDRTRWVWQVIHRAEERFDRLVADHARHPAPGVREALERALRELVLLQASDWPFVVHTGGAVDYGFRRIALHADRFDRMCNLAQDLAAGRPADRVQEVERLEVDVHDDLFPAPPLSLDLWAR